MRRCSTRIGGGLVVKKIMLAFCAFVPAFIVSGCQVDTDTDGKDSPEVIDVSEQAPDAQRYDIDLNRNAIYVLPPAIDMHRLFVTCPTLATISFDDYIATRIRPTGVKYDPALHILRLANAEVQFEPFSPKEVDQLGSVLQDKPCIYDCYDAGSWEQCINPDC
jgi:hypothetical protein